MRPITALLIANDGKRCPGGRRRLCLTSSLAEGSETAVRIIAISTTACLIEDHCEAPSELSQTWLKLPHKGPVQVLIEPAPNNRLVCTFCQPLHPAEVEALSRVNPAPVLEEQRRPRLRCSFL